MPEFEELYRLVFVDWASSSGWSGPMLHMNAGLGVMVIGRILSGWPLGSMRLLGLVCFAALLKEAFDFFVYGMIKPDSIWDVVYTVGWPAILCAAANMRRNGTG